MDPRLHGLSDDELSSIGDVAALKAAVEQELNGFAHELLSDAHGQYTDDQVRDVVNARLAALPEHGLERTAIQKTYELLLVVIDGGVADARSDHELLLWINGNGSERCPGFRPVVDEAPA